MDACLGLRVFSKNHVGSAMLYLPCVPVKSAPPEAPLIEGVFSNGSETAPTFEVRWSAQREGDLCLHHQSYWSERDIL